MESLATGEVIEVLDTGGQTGYLAAREAARRDGAPSRHRWHYGKGVTQAFADAGEEYRDWFDWAGKRYVFVANRGAGVAVSDLNRSDAVRHTITGPPAGESPPAQRNGADGASQTAAGVRRGGGSWSQAENEATVSSYLSMLKRELTGEPYNKTEERRRLLAELDDARNEAAIEFKHQNISAILAENGWVYINGYKPAINIQRTLRLEVERQLREDQELDRLMQRHVETTAIQPLDASTVADMTEVDPPEAVFGAAEWNPRGIKRDYLYQDAKNRRLGLEGELVVMAMEKKRLLDNGCHDLAARVDHAAVTIGDGLGYDIHSFEMDGSDRLIEVKTTVYDVETPFFISHNEVDASAHYGQRFYLYRLFRFGSKSCGWYQLRGPIAETCDLQPKAYVALPLPE